MVQATKKAQSGPPQKKAAYPYPSRFGSHSSMVNTSKEATGGPHMSVLTDEHGDYETDYRNINSGLADPARYATSRLGKLFANEAKK